MGGKKVNNFNLIKNLRNKINGCTIYNSKEDIKKIIDTVEGRLYSYKREIKHLLKRNEKQKQEISKLQDENYRFKKKSVELERLLYQTQQCQLIQRQQCQLNQQSQQQSQEYELFGNSNRFLNLIE